MKFRRILLILAIATLSLTACKKEENPVPTETTAVEDTITGITKVQLTTLYENAKSVYAETPELFTEDADISIIDLAEISDADIPVSEAITFDEAMQILKEDNIPEEILDEVAKQVGLITGEESRWDEALTKNEALNFILRIYENMETITNADRGAAQADVDASTTENTGDYEGGVDINGVDGTVEEGDYDEEIHAAPETTESEGASSALDNITPEQRETLENLIDDLLETRGITLDENGQPHIPADPAAEAALGGTYGTTESTNPGGGMDYNVNDPSLVGGSLE